MQKKYKIIALFGPAGSGKDYIKNAIKNTIWGKNLNYIISHTSRPPRDNEKDGIQYHFMKESPFHYKNLATNWIEYNFFNSWFYGTSIDDLDINKINIGIFTPSGINQMLNNSQCEVYPIYIHTTDKIRLLRQLNRESNPDCYEICRRFQADTNDFLNLRFSYKVIENNTHEIQFILNDLYFYYKEICEDNII